MTRRHKRKGGKLRIAILLTAVLLALGLVRLLWRIARPDERPRAFHFAAPEVPRARQQGEQIDNGERRRLRDLLREQTR